MNMAFFNHEINGILRRGAPLNLVGKNGGIERVSDGPWDRSGGVASWFNQFFLTTQHSFFWNKEVPEGT